MYIFTVCYDYVHAKIKPCLKSRDLLTIHVLYTNVTVQSSVVITSLSHQVIMMIMR